MARTAAEGAAKYGDRNWEKGIPISNLLNHCIRHIYLYILGDTSEDHLAHGAWNLLAACDMEEVRPECCDIPSRGNFVKGASR